MMKCPYCGSKDVYYDTDRGEYYCAQCGMVIEDGVCEEVGEYSSATYLVGSSTDIGYEVEYKKKTIFMKRLNRWTNAKEYKLWQIYTTISHIAPLLKMSSFEVSEAKILAKRYYDTFKYMGADMVGWVTSFVVLRLYNGFVNWEIVERDFSRYQVKKMRKKVREVLSAERRRRGLEYSVRRLYDTAVSVLGLTGEGILIGRDIIRELGDSFGRDLQISWVSVSAVLDLLRLLGALDITQAEISDGLHVSAVGLRLARGKIISLLGYDSVDDFIDDYRKKYGVEA